MGNTSSSLMVGPSRTPSPLPPPNTQLTACFQLWQLQSTLLHTHPKVATCRLMKTYCTIRSGGQRIGRLHSQPEVHEGLHALRIADLNTCIHALTYADMHPCLHARPERAGTFTKVWHGAICVNIAPTFSYNMKLCCMLVTQRLFFRQVPTHLHK